MFNKSSAFLMYAVLFYGRSLSSGRLLCFSEIRTVLNLLVICQFQNLPDSIKTHRRNSIQTDYIVHWQWRPCTQLTPFDRCYRFSRSPRRFIYLSLRLWLWLCVEPYLFCTSWLKCQIQVLPPVLLLSLLFFCFQLFKLYILAHFLVRFTTQWTALSISLMYHINSQISI